MTLANDIARCPGYGSDEEGWREGCDDVEREACAQIVTDAALAATDAGNLREYELLRKLAAAIRARGDA